MQAKNYNTKLIKFPYNLTLRRTLKGSEIRLHYSNKYFEMLQDKRM